MVWPFSGGRAKKFKHVFFNDDQNYVESDSERIPQKDTVNPNSASTASLRHFWAQGKNKF